MAPRVPYVPLSVPLDDMRADLAASVQDPDAETMAWFHAGRTGRSPAAFSDFCIRCGLAEALGVDRAYLEPIGAALDAAATARGRNDDSTRRRAAKILDAEAHRLVRQARRGEHVEAGLFFLTLLDMLRAEYRREPGGGVWPNLKYATAFGRVIAAIKHSRRHSLPYDLDAIIERVADALGREAISRTDVRTAVKQFTRKVPLDDWLTPS